ncbi:MAG: ATP-dependent DNA helicase RecG, partial [Planctomycetota bacterium]
RGGRTGGGGGGGLCVLVDRSSRERPARLDVLEHTDDGFQIAEEDLLLRGVGDVLGTRQHGRPAFHAARLPRDLERLLAARDAAQRLLDRDPSLQRPAHRALADLVARRVEDEGGELDGD